MMDAKISAQIKKYSVHKEVKAFLESEQKMYIAGAFVPAESGETMDVTEPSTAGYLTSIPSAGQADVDRAVKAARDAFEAGDWAQMKPNQRQKLLHRLATLIEEHAQIIAEIETIDNGKALSSCIDFDVLGSADLLHYMAGWATKIQGATRTTSIPGESFSYTLKEPIGVVAAIVPWNWPFSMAMWKLAAPLATGCTIVLKPAQQTSLSMLYFARLCAEAGIPDGVINIVTGSGSRIGNNLSGHLGVNKVSFTGSTEVGRLVGQAALQHMTRMTLELGGKSAMVAFADADIQALADSTRWSIFFNAGQVCSAGSRLYVERSIYEQTLEAIAQVARNMLIAPGLDPACDMGPVISVGAQQSILGYIEQGKKEGARLVTGGKAVDGSGYFIEPTLFADCHNDMTVMREEIFGPVLCVAPFDTEEEAIRLANDSIYGLAASVWTQDISRALRIVPQLQAGTVGVNCHDKDDNSLPFGGYKLSGFGKDRGPEQLDHFLETKTVVISIGD